MFVVNEKTEQVSEKLAYLKRIRSETAYGTYRVIVNICAVVGGLVGIVMMALSFSGNEILAFLFWPAVLTIAGSVFFRAAAYIPADIADAVMDAFSEEEGDNHGE